MKNFIKKLPWWIKFLIFMLFLYVIWFILSPELITNSIISTLSSLKELFPILLIAFIIIFIINAFLKPESIKKHLGKDSGIKWWIYTIIWSFFIMMPTYVILPMLWEFKTHGMKNSLLALFMNTRNLQLAFLPVMAYYFWLKFTVIIFILNLIFAIINALIIDRMLSKN